MIHRHLQINTRRLLPSSLSSLDGVHLSGASELASRAATAFLTFAGHGLSGSCPPARCQQAHPAVSGRHGHSSPPWPSPLLSPGRG